MAAAQSDFTLSLKSMRCKFTLPLMLKVVFLGFVVLCLYFSGPEAFQSALEPRELPRAKTEVAQSNRWVSKNRHDPSQRRTRETKDAYVTLLYGGFLLGARVLGQSLKETGTKKDIIALCTETVSDATKEVLKKDGWTIQSVANIHSPYEGLSKRGDYFSGIFSKLHIWNMTEYDRVTYLDSDVLVVSNIDHMFDCGTFCAAFRHSDLFNAGIIVVEPNNTVFKDMLEKIGSLPSYDDGDQGFLNVYFKNLVYAPFFNWSNTSRQHQPMRMPAGLNSDIGPYYANSRWAIPPGEIRNIHYTLGPVKPWIWWTNFLFDLNVHWTDVRMRLPRYSGRHDTYRPVYQPMFWSPFPILLLLYIGMRFIECSRHKWLSTPLISAALKLFTSLNDRISQLFPLPFVALSYYLAYRLVVPTTMLPSQAEYIFWLWSNLFLLIIVGFYCYLCHLTAKRSDNYHHSVPRKKLWMLVLYLIFTVSYILLKVVPPVVTPFSKRVKVFFFLLFLHIVVAQITGLFLVKLWKFKKGSTGCGDPESNGSVSPLNLKVYH